MENEVQHTEEHFTLKEKILYTLGSIVIVGGSFLLGRKIVRKTIADKEEKKTFTEDTSPTWAKQIKMAFENDGWPGTDTEKLRSVIREIPSQNDFAKVNTAYQKLYNSSMMKDMEDELQSTEYNEMLSIIAAKPKKRGEKVPLNYNEWAKRLKAAFDKSYGIFPGTDEDAIKAVFLEIPTQADFEKTGAAYQKLYGTNLMDDLKGELEFWEISDYLKIITDKPKE